MSSNASPPGKAWAAADVALQLAEAIDECAAAARGASGADGPDLSGRLAAIWAMLADADPDLAVSTARYARS